MMILISQIKRPGISSWPSAMTRKIHADKVLKSYLRLKIISSIFPKIKAMNCNQLIRTVPQLHLV